MLPVNVASNDVTSHCFLGPKAKLWTNGRESQILQGHNVSPPQANWALFNHISLPPLPVDNYSHQIQFEMTRKKLQWNKVQQLCLPEKSTMASLCKTGLSSCIIPLAASKASMLQEQKQRDFYQSLTRLSAREPPCEPLMIIELLGKDR